MPSGKVGKWRSVPLWWVALAAGLMLRLWFLRHQMIPDDDSDVYADLARNLFHHGIYGVTDGTDIDPTLIRVPGYPIFLGLIFAVFGAGNFTAVLVVQIVLDLLGCWLLASFLCEQVSRRVGTIALFLAALCPFTASYSTMALTESLTVFAISLALWSAGRVLRAQADGRVDRFALLWASFATSLAMLLRPDGALLAIAIAAALIWYALRQRSIALGLRTAAAFLMLSALPLVPWTIRNWRTFHVVQPLAPRRVNDPGEYVTYGFYRWMRTWSVDVVSTGSVFWNLGSDRINLGDLPSRAFDSPAQRAETAALLAEYNATRSIPAQLDAKFNALAAEREHAHPFRTRVWVPLLRVMDMVLRPRTETLDLDPAWWTFHDTPRKTADLAALALLNLALVAAALAGLVRRQVPWPALAVVYVILRCALLSTMENSEPRYTLELLPFFVVCAACALSAIRVPRFAAVPLESEQIPA